MAFQDDEFHKLHLRLLAVEGDVKSLPAYLMPHPHIIQSSSVVIPEGVAEKAAEANTHLADGSGSERWPDGSGTERYDHWTQHSDGTDYPTPKPFEPFMEDPVITLNTAFPADHPDLNVGDSVRALNDDGSVDPAIHTVSSISEDGALITLNNDHPAYPRDRVVRVVS
jgi:hypothetical protein